MDRTTREFDLELVDMREGRAPPNVGAFWDPEDPPPPPADWVSGCFQEPSGKIYESSNMEAEGDWQAPKIFGKQVKRAVVG